MSRRGPSLGERLLALVLLVVFAALAITSLRVKNPTFDETAHLAAGISYVQLDDYRMNPEHPVLPKRIAGAAATARGARAHDDSPAWESGEQWDYARELLYERNDDWRGIVNAGRMPMVFLGVLLGAVLWVWTRSLAGPVSAGIALALYAFSPTFLAHTRLVTTDVPLALTVVAASACLWQAWRTDRLGWTLAAAFCVGLSMVTKFSAFSYAPAWAVLLLVPSAARPFGRGLVHLGVFVVAAFLLTEALVFVSYGFAMDWTTIRSLGMTDRGVSPEDMAFFRRIPFEIMASIPWPSADFAEGMKTIILYTEAGHPVFLNGMRADQGWWWAPLVALGLKAPLPFLLLVAVSVGLLVRHRELRRGDLWFVVVPALLVLGTNLAAKLGIGVRHLLPMFPFLMILAAWPFRAGFRPAGGLAVLAALALGWQAVGTVRAHPHYLPWFNEVAGGPSGGARYLGDSNLDWGQDLSAAAAWLRERGAEQAVLCYFGTASPFVEGIEWQVLPPASRARNRDPWTVMTPDIESEQWLAMSVTNLQGIYYRSPDGGEAYPWLADVKPEHTVGGTIHLYEIGHNADVQYGMAGIYRRHGLVEEEEASLRRALKQREFFADARMQLTALLERQGRIRDAVDLIIRSPNPEVEEILQVHELHKQLGELDLAQQVLERGMVGYPGSGELKNQLAWFLQEHDGDLGLALEVIDAAIVWDPSDPYYRDTRAMVHMKRGDFAEAMADLDAAVALPGGDLAEIHWHRALIHDAAGRSYDAEQAADAVLARRDVTDSLYEEIGEWLASR
ncbi:MAG: phospholipid carrier-dependent glycosyltransferase [Gemmatimonadetes bacterium]|nr:phospholipid carrier-dependent glycosyltransferase [Gemmatimonadota bacterium]